MHHLKVHRSVEEGMYVVLAFENGNSLEEMQQLKNSALENAVFSKPTENSKYELRILC